MGSRRITTAVLVLALLAGAVLLLRYRPLLALTGKAGAALQGGGGEARAQPRPPPAFPAAQEERSTLADNLNSPKTDVHSDLRLINQIFIAYRAGVRDGNPVGENVEITAALRGRNKIGFAFIPPDCPALNAKGQLCDRWGDPYFFHQISGERMEIRSAGPDRVLWTGDDEVLTP